MAAPANDNLANARILSGADGLTVTGTSAEATSESGEVKGSADSTTPVSAAGFKTVWFRWKPVAFGQANQINTTGSSFDTYLTIFQAKSGVTEPVTAHADLEIVASNDDSGGSTSAITFTPSSRNYYIQVCGYGAADGGNYTLNYWPATNNTALYDNLADAAVLANGTTQVVGSSADASSEPGEISLSASGTGQYNSGTNSDTNRRTVWFRWRAPSNSSATFTTAGSSYDTVLSIFKAKSGVSDPVTAVTDLDLVAANDDVSGSDSTSSVTITPVASTDYYLQIRGWSGQGGAYTLNYPSPASSGGASTTANAGQAAVTAAGQNPAAVSVSNVVANASTAAVTSAGQNPTVATTLLLSQVSDTFDDNVNNTTLWSGDYGTTGESGGKATITADTGYSAKRTGTIYRFDSVFAQPTPPPVGTSTSGSFDFNVYSAAQPGGTDLAFYLDFVTGQLYFVSRVGYFDASATAITYDPVAHAWWRMRRSGGNVLWDTSPDGATWTNRRTLAEPAWVSANPADVAFRLEAHRNDGAGGVATLDNFNLGASATTASASTADVTTAGQSASAQTTVTVTAGLGAVAVDAQQPAAVSSVTATAGLADVAADAYNPTVSTVSSVTANAGAAAVGTDGLNPAVTASATIPTGQADVSADAYGATTVTAGLPPAGLAAVSTDAYNPTAAVSYTALAGQADVGADANSPSLALASTAAPGTAGVDVSAANASVSTSSSVTVNADVAQVSTDAYPAGTSAVQSAGQAAVSSDGYGATVTTVAAGIANAGTADVTADALSPAAQPALVTLAGQAASTADAYGPTVSTEAATTAFAGTADVTSVGQDAAPLTAVITLADVAAVTATAYEATVSTAAATTASALAAQAAAEAFGALVQASSVAYAGTALVGVEALAVPKKRIPGVLRAGTTRSRLTAGTHRGPTYGGG